MIAINQLSFSYADSSFRFAIDHLEIEQGERIAIIGPSGIGKTTLLNLIAGIYLPESGKIAIQGKEINSLSDRERRLLRVKEIGFVFQDFKLVEYLPVSDNIVLPFRINRSLSVTEPIKKRAVELADELGIGQHLNKYPGTLSQGEKQRVAICRALINKPKIILADEPTGNLDPENKIHIMETLIKYSEDSNATLINVTHDHDLLNHVDRTIDFQKILEQ